MRGLIHLATIFQLQGLEYHIGYAQDAAKDVWVNFRPLTEAVNLEQFTEDGQRTLDAALAFLATAIECFLDTASKWTNAPHYIHKDRASLDSHHQLSRKEPTSEEYLGTPSIFNPEDCPAGLPKVQPSSVPAEEGMSSYEPPVGLMRNAMARFTKHKPKVERKQVWK